jgi:hypothetical protein
MDTVGKCEAAALAAEAPVFPVLPGDCSVFPMGVSTNSFIRVSSDTQDNPFPRVVHLHTQPAMLANPTAKPDELSLTGLRAGYYR